MATKIATASGNRLPCGGTPYKAVAFVLRADRMEAKIRPEDDALLNVITDLADLFDTNNPDFDKSAFLLACGLESEQREHGDPLTNDCGHKINEDCMNCQVCGRCTEDLNDADVCDGCYCGESEG